MSDIKAWIPPEPTEEERLRDEARIIIRWFGGAKHHWSGYDPAKVYWDAEENKFKIDKAIKKTALTELTLDEWIEHRTGNWSLGIYLIDENNQCVAGCIDIDKGPNTNPVAWAKIVAEKKLPLTVFESRSDKTHLFLFANEPIPARLMRRNLTKYIALLDLPLDTEIFPKQDTVKWESGAYGSWINAPFFGDKRWPIGPDGERLPLTPVPPKWQSPKFMAEFVGPEDKPTGEKKKGKGRRRAKNEDDPFNADDAERWLEYHAERIANAPEDTANFALRDAIWSLGHMHEFFDRDDVEEALREGWHLRKKGDREFEEAFDRSWEKAVKHAEDHPDDLLPIWPEPVIVRNFSNVIPKLVKWLGRGWTAIGQIAMWSGDSDVGKTTSLIDYISKLTTGGVLPFTGERLPVKRVLMAIAEDDEEDTIAPRLIPAGANMAMFDQLVGYMKRDGTEGEICIDTEQGRKRIEDALSKHPGEYGLLVFDPDTAFLSRGFQTNDVVAWRSLIMKPMKKIARRHGVAVQFISHPRKSKQGELAQHSVSGSLAQVQASRIHAIFGDEFEIEIDLTTGFEKKVRTGNFLMAFSRAANMPRSEKRKTRIGRVVGGDVMIEGEQTSIGGIEWVGIREDVTADDVASNRGGVGDLTDSSGDPKKPSKQEQAKAFLRRELTGKGLVAESVLKARAKEQDFSWPTVLLVKKEVGVELRYRWLEEIVEGKPKKVRHWYWWLADKSQTEMPFFEDDLSDEI